MSDYRLYNTKSGVRELTPSTVVLEKELQTLIENNMESFFGVRFIKSEYIIKDGRMDSIGIDENYCPVIFEYKKSTNANVINQGLFYLDWLLDHKGDFKLLVMEKFGAAEADKIDWSYPCVVCVASEFNKYDVHAVKQMQKNIKLVKYRKYEDDLFSLEFINAPKTEALASTDAKKDSNTKTHLEKLESASAHIKSIYDQVCEFIEEQDDEIVANQLKLYRAYKKISNIACIEIHQKEVVVYLKLDKSTVNFEDGFSRDVSQVGHLGTGDVRLSIASEKDLNKAKSLIERAIKEA